MPRQRAPEWWKGIFSVEYLAWTGHGAYFPRALATSTATPAPVGCTRDDLDSGKFPGRRGSSTAPVQL